jgi:hypothetical protein
MWKFASDGRTVVEYLPHHLKVEGLSPALLLALGEKIWQKNKQWLIQLLLLMLFQ